MSKLEQYLEAAWWANATYDQTDAHEHAIFGDRWGDVEGGRVCCWFFLLDGYEMCVCVCVFLNIVYYYVSVDGFDGSKIAERKFST